MRFPRSFGSVLSAWVLMATFHAAWAADIYGYVDDKGVAHFASE